MGIKSGAAYSSVGNVCSYVWNYILSSASVFWSRFLRHFRRTKRTNSFLLSVFWPSSSNERGLHSPTLLDVNSLLFRTTHHGARFFFWRCRKRQLQMKSFSIILCSKQIFISRKNGIKFGSSERQQFGWLEYVESLVKFVAFEFIRNESQLLLSIIYTWRIFYSWWWWWARAFRPRSRNRMQIFAFSRMSACVSGIYAKHFMRSQIIYFFLWLIQHLCAHYCLA